ncbi:MAG: ATP-binding protein [Paludibacteraceae bacterium]|nr:ATP-binding protein [Paludibacteraceae bacterium]
MTSIVRHEYLEQLMALKDKQVIKIITGIRRCGKSTLLQQFRDYLISIGTDTSQIISLNFEDIDNEHLCDYHTLYSYIKERLHPSLPTYLFFDEIQQVKSFQKVIDALYIKPNIDIYLTGSNAYMLSQDIATLLSGRYIEIRMLPFSYNEYSASYFSSAPLSTIYKDYVTYGSFPYVSALQPNQSLVIEYLRNLFNTIILKDIVTRYKVADVMMLQSVIQFMFDNIGNPVSSKSIADTLTSSGRKIDVRTVEKFLYAMTESYVLYKATRYDIRGKQHLKTLGKYYIVDVGLRMMLLGNRKYDTGRVLENVIYLELRRRYHDVYVGKWDNTEVDFVCMAENGLVYYQVAETTREQSTLERELRPLKQINDSYPKYLLTLDEDPVIDYNGIQKCNAIEWLRHY